MLAEQGAKSAILQMRRLPQSTPGLTPPQHSQPRGPSLLRNPAAPSSRLALGTQAVASPAPWSHPRDTPGWEQKQEVTCGNLRSWLWGLSRPRLESSISFLDKMGRSGNLFAPQFSDLVCGNDATCLREEVGL